MAETYTAKKVYSESLCSSNVSHEIIDQRRIRVQRLESFPRGNMLSVINTSRRKICIPKEREMTTTLTASQTNDMKAVGEHVGLTIAGQDRA